jgi:hypothetical protein
VGASGGVVTLLCGHWRVTQMPLATITAHLGTTVAPGDHLGTVARSRDHGGLHLGARRDGTRFGYVDPLRFLRVTTTTPPPLGRAPRARRPTPPAGEMPERGRTRTTAPLTSPLPRPIATRPTEPVSPSRGRLVSPSPAVGRGVVSPRGGAAAGTRLAPWPVWVGLALVLGGAGVGVRWRGTRRTRTLGRVRASVRLSE